MLLGPTARTPLQGFLKLPYFTLFPPKGIRIGVTISINASDFGVVVWAPL